MGECLSICGKKSIEEDEKIYKKELEKESIIIENTGRTKKNKTRLPKNFKDLDADDDDFDQKIQNDIEQYSNQNDKPKLNEEIINKNLKKEDKKEGNTMNDKIKKQNSENDNSVDFAIVKKTSTEILKLEDSKESDSKINKNSVSKNQEFVESEEIDEGEKETHGKIVDSDDDES